MSKRISSFSARKKEEGGGTKKKKKDKARENGKRVRRRESPACLRCLLLPFPVSSLCALLSPLTLFTVLYPPLPPHRRGKQLRRKSLYWIWPLSLARDIARLSSAKKRGNVVLCSECRNRGHNRDFTKQKPFLLRPPTKSPLGPRPQQQNAFVYGSALWERGKREETQRG